jgi:hypothetical protein
MCSNASTTGAARRARCDVVFRDSGVRTAVVNGPVMKAYKQVNH